MRIIVIGVGAIGGVLAAALTRSGQDVIGVARGEMLSAITENGLRFLSPDYNETIRFPCVGSIADIDFRPDDAILICVKGQHTDDVLHDLRAAGVEQQPVFCTQNGIANEEKALRFFPNVHGMTVMIPAGYTVPGQVAVYATPCFGLLDIGRFPDGTDDDDTAMARALEAANFHCLTDRDVMASKRGKMLNNLNNILGAALGKDADVSPWREAMHKEALAAYAAAGMRWREIGTATPARRQHAQIKPVEGAPPYNGSTYQSLLRGTGNMETDLLNGEIVFLGRRYGVPTPVNAGMCALAARMLREGAGSQSMTMDDLPQL